MDRDAATRERMEAPAVMLVALEARIEELCTAALAGSWIRVLKVRHASAACERVPVIMPKMVVAPLTLTQEEATALLDRIVAVGARPVWVEPDIDPDVLRRRLTAAVKQSLGTG